MGKARDEETEPGVRDVVVRALLLHPDQEALDRLCGWLTEAGCEARGVQNPAGAWTALREGEFDVLVADTTFPETTPANVVRLAERHAPQTAVLLIATPETRAAAVEAVAAGARGYMLEPVSRGELVAQAGAASGPRAAPEEPTGEPERPEPAGAADADQGEVIVCLLRGLAEATAESEAHLYRVGASAALLAEALGWSRADQARIRIAGAMHDMGKFVLARDLLTKPGMLTNEEFDEVQKHALIGASIVGDSEQPMIRMARDVACSHHEKWDGSGYPFGLAGEQIPEAARIVAITDVYDALVHDQPYREAMDEERAARVMRRQKESSFDPRMVDRFLELLPRWREQEEAYEAEARDGSATPERLRFVGPS
ncbi:MAG: HD domain-containing protein [Planctomycetota bacterium]